LGSKAEGRAFESRRAHHFSRVWAAASQAAQRRFAMFNSLPVAGRPKSFAIGTYFRDSSDATGDPSLIVYVDPPASANGEQTPVE